MFVFEKEEFRVFRDGDQFHPIKRVYVFVDFLFYIYDFLLLLFLSFFFILKDEWVFVDFEKAVHVAYIRNLLIYLHAN